MRTIEALAASVIVATAAAASAQESAATVSASVAATNMESRTELTFAGTFGYRFTRTLGLEIEATYVPSLKSPVPGVTVQNFSTAAGTALADSIGAIRLVFPGPTYANPSGRVVVLSNDIRIELPTTAPRLTPYFVAGGGGAHARRPGEVPVPPPPPLAGALALPLPR